MEMIFIFNLGKKLRSLGFPTHLTTSQLAGLGGISPSIVTTNHWLQGIKLSMFSW